MPYIRYIPFAFLLLFLSARLSAQSDVDSIRKEIARYDLQKEKDGRKGFSMKDTVRIKMLSSLVNLIYMERHDEAIRLSNQQLAISKAIGYDWGIAHAYNLLGTTADATGEYAKARAYYTRSIEHMKKIGSETGIIDAYGNIGISFAKQGNYPEALRNTMKALGTARKIKDRFGMLGCYNNLGTIYNIMGRYDDAVKVYTICLDMLKPGREDGMLCVVYQNLGELYLLQEKPQSAVPYYEKGITAAKKSGNAESLANLYNSMGRVKTDAKRFGEALRYLKMALEIRQRIGDVYGETSSYLTLADTYRNQKQYGQAIQNLMLSLEKSEESGTLDLQSQGYKNLSETYEAIGDYRNAFRYLSKYKQAADSLQNSEKTKEITEIQMNFEFGKIQDSIRSLQEKKDLLARKKSDEQRSVRNYTYAGLSLIVIFLSVLVIQRNKISRIKREKALEEERNRISRELHDNLGARLSTAKLYLSTVDDGKGRDPKAIRNSIEMLDTSIHDLRNIMSGLHGTEIDAEDFVAATEEMVNKINQLKLVDFAISHHRMREKLDPKVGHDLFRITQELVNNTLKYSGARHISLDVVRHDDRIVLMYEDDGKGFDPAAKRGYGLSNIESRVAGLSGSVEFDSAPGAGSRATIEIPYRDA